MKLVHVKQRNHLTDLGKLLQERTDSLHFKLRKIDLPQQLIAIANKIKDNLGVNVSRHTVSRRLNEQRLMARTPSTKPFISKKNQLARKENSLLNTSHGPRIINGIVSISVMSQSSICLVLMAGGYVRRSVTERYSPKCIKRSVKFGGGSVMVFSMISAAGPGPLVRLHERINAAVY